MPNPKIFVTQRLPEPVEKALEISGSAQLRPDNRLLTPDKLAVMVTTAEILIPTITDRIDRAMLLQAPKLRLIANFGAGVEHIDCDAARELGIAVTNTPDALTETTAELAVTLMLMAARGAGAGERLLRAGQWKGWGPTDQLGQGLSGKLLGLVGFGRIARATAARARAFGMRVVCHSRKMPDKSEEVQWFSSLDALAAEVDVLSLHVPGGEATRHMIDRELLALMKPNAIVINTARGSVVDEAALAEALREGRIAAAGLDVFEAEPKVHPALLDLENVVLLPHLGSATLETRTAMGMQVLANVEAYLTGRDLPNRVV